MSRIYKCDACGAAFEPTRFGTLPAGSGVVSHAADIGSGEMARPDLHICAGCMMELDSYLAEMARAKGA